jgi:hypothetical protein
MSASASIDPSGSITPCELVFLHGEKFAKKVMVGNTKLLHNDVKVSTARLGEAMVKAAFLASEAIGAIRLEVRQKKAMLGLRKVKSLYADPVGEGTWWPPLSLEADICYLARAYQADRENHEVSNILSGWLREDATSPWHVVIERVKANMAERGRLEVVKEKRLKVFTTTRYKLPESTATLVASQSIEPILQLIEECERERPAVWKLLGKHIKSAISSRTIDDNY